MRKLLLIYICLLAAFLAACDGFVADGLTAVDSIQIMRYDRVQARYLTTGDFAALQEMNTVYPTQTRALVEDLLKLGSVSDVNINRKLLEYYRDTTLQNIIHVAELDYADMEDLDRELKSAFRNLKKELPNMEIPRFYAQIGALDQSIVVDDKTIGISLDKYLGKDYPPYLRFYDERQRGTMTREYIVPDIVVFYLLSQYIMPDLFLTTQFGRDTHMGIMMYAANKVIGRKIFDDINVSRIESYVKKHPGTGIRQLLEMVNYSVFEH